MGAHIIGSFVDGNICYSDWVYMCKVYLCGCSVGFSFVIPLMWLNILSCSLMLAVLPDKSRSTNPAKVVRLW